MSIFHISDIKEKPSSYTRDIQNKEINYNTIRSEVRTSIIDKYSSFNKLTNPSQAVSPGRSPKRFNNTMKAIDMLFGKKEEQTISGQCSPAKISGLKKKMQSIGGGTIYPDQYSSQKFTFLSPQGRQQGGELNKSIRSGSMSAKNNLVKSNMSSSIPIQRLVEIQNILELTPQSELEQLPRNYLDELARVAASITRNLRHHHDIRGRA